MADSILAMAVGLQADRDTESANMVWWPFPIDIGWEPQLDKEVPEFKTATRMGELRAFAKYNTMQIPFKGAADSLYLGYLASSAYGKATRAGSTHSFKMGRSGVNSIYMTIYIYEDPGWYWALIGAKVNLFNVGIDVASAFMTMDGTIVGPKPIKRTTSVPTPAFTLPADKTPFQPWSSVIQRNASPYRIVSMMTNIDNGFLPFYETGTAFPASNAEAGLDYSRLQEGMVHGRYTLAAKYDGTVVGPYEDALTNTEDAWILEARDTTTSPARVAMWTLPKTIGLTPGRDLGQVVKRISVNGAMLYDPATGTVGTLALTNEKATDYI